VSGSQEIYLSGKRFILMASPLIAVILSFFIPGLGQFYTGQLLKAVLLFIAAVIFGGLSTILIGIPFYIIIWLYSMYDAYTTAKESEI
jgi:TM2 domain-containing membrane protein YozV